MRFTLPIAALALLALPLGHPASAQEDGGAKRKLDAALSVLRVHQDAAGKSCLDAMTRVHQTEDQVGNVTRESANGDHANANADIARDVLESDYENAETACAPDAVQACRSDPHLPACAKFGAISDN
ncbi:hypothetical protein NFI95_01870 [Acetobacteraceae bacterium KSS8]|uniref:Secreted protein n=1 Tax=Endosaccharibacter trunci TaxID=2812733 RepID=A0ABT1W2W0_9PROT|nr:hypothetical protein [Acetobacteraceae bacterium KSS8]